MSLIFKASHDFRAIMGSSSLGHSIIIVRNAGCVRLTHCVQVINCIYAIIRKAPIKVYIRVIMATRLKKKSRHSSCVYCLLKLIKNIDLFANFSLDPKHVIFIK